MTRRTRKPATPEELFEANKGLPYHIAKRYKVPEEDYQDMIQEGMLALWRACLGYDPSKGKFSTYAGAAIGHAYEEFTHRAWNNSGLSAWGDTLKAAYKASIGEGEMKEGFDRLLDDVLSLEYYAYKEGDADVTIADLLATEDDYTHMNDEAIHDVIEEAMWWLDVKERNLLIDRYGLDGEEPMTLQAIGDKNGVSATTVQNQLRQVYKRIIQFIPAHAADLLE